MADAGKINSLTVSGGAGEIFSAVANNNTDIGESFVDVALGTEHAKTSNMSHTTNSAEVTVNTSGYFVITAHLTCQEDAIDRGCVYVQLMRDTGGGYSVVSGTEVTVYVRGNNITQLNEEGTSGFTIGLNVTSGDKFKIQIKNHYSLADTQLIGSGSALTIYKVA